MSAAAGLVCLHLHYLPSVDDGVKTIEQGIALCRGLADIWPDVWGAPNTLFGVFGTTWYHKLPLPGVADFVKRWQAAFPQSPIPVPGNVSYNGYMATRELLRAIERAGSTNNIAVIKQLEGLKISAADRMQHFDAYIDPVTHQVQQTIYLARRNAKPADPTDLFEVISWTRAEQAIDDAAPGKCKLKSYAEVPTFEL